MPARRLLLYIFLAILLSHCSPAARLLYGIRQPKAKTERQMVKSIHKYHFEHLPNYAISYDGFLRHFKEIKVVNDIAYYSPEGYRIEFKDSMDCSGDKVQYIDRFQDTALTRIADSATLDELYSELRAMNGDPIPTLDSGKHLIVFYWASYAGRLNRQLNQEWIEKASKLDTTTVKIINVSLDMRTFWEMH